jgi:RNA polymerase subunit RPABC4/transcription elongation factor Spt4
MAIRVVCPNGHALKVPDDFAGKMGMCPVCKSRVRVPRTRSADLSENAILGLIGPVEGDEGAVGAGRSASQAAGDGVSSGVKACDRCHREIPAHLHICPHCHTYIASLAEL